MDYGATATALVTSVGSTFADVMPVGVAILTAFLGWKILKRIAK